MLRDLTCDPRTQRDLLVPVRSLPLEKQALLLVSSLLQVVEVVFRIEQLNRQALTPSTVHLLPNLLPFLPAGNKGYYHRPRTVEVSRYGRFGRELFANLAAKVSESSV